jgi:hypothetical protein
VLVHYANERFLYRLAQSTHRDAFILKGASLFAIWQGQMPRATKDVDLLGTGAPNPARLRAVFADVLSTVVAPDGVTFDLESIAAEAIREEAVYDGVRVTFGARLGTAVIPLQVDVGKLRLAHIHANRYRVRELDGGGRRRSVEGWNWPWAGYGLSAVVEVCPRRRAREGRPSCQRS